VNGEALAQGSLLALLGLLVGAWTGVSGYSGWPLLVPTLSVTLGRPLQETLAASLCVDWFAASAASPSYVRRAGVDVRFAARLACLLIPFGLAGAALGFAILPRFASVLGSGAGPIAILIGSSLVARSWRLRGDPSGAGAPLTAVAFGPFIRTAGVAATGFASGLIGMGGGFVLTLLLWLTGRAPPGTAVGTGLVATAFGLPVILAAHLAHARPGWAASAALLPACLSAAVGAALSARGAGRLPTRYLGIAIGACVALAGLVAATRAVWLDP
jgi:uncharacterized protein